MTNKSNSSLPIDESISDVTSLLADTKWSSFPPSAPLSTSDYLVGLQTGINVKILNSSLVTLMNNNVQIAESQVTNLVSDLASKLNLSGGTMTGFLTLNADPTTNLQASTKQYVDNGLALKLNLSGGTMTGNLILNADPTINLQATTKQYVDNGLALKLNLSGGTMTGNLILNADPTTSLQATTKQYVDNGLTLKLNLSGGTMTGNLILNANPTLPLQAATKQYVDGSIVVPTFQTVYNNSSPPSFNITSSGFQINNNLSTPLFGVFNSLIYMYSPVKFIMGSSSISNYAVAQFNSTQYGILPPVLTNTQEATLTALLGSPDVGLQWFNSTNNIISYWDGLDKQDVLAIGNIIQGSNMTITDNGNGTVTFASSGGGSSSTQVQGSFNSSSPTTPTPVTNLDTPIAVSGGSFNVVNAVGTNVSLATISGVQTVIIQNTTTGGRWCTINYDLSLLITTNSNQTYGFTVFTNTGGIAFFKEFTVTGTAPLYRDFNISTPVIYLNTNDYVYLTVNSSINTGPSFIAYYFNGRLVDTTVASLPSTDALSQGTNNVYLSQNGGTTYEYLSGSATIGDVPKFNSTGGQLIDSGIAASSILTTSSAAGGDLSGSYPDPIVSKINTVPVASSTVSDGQILIGSTLASNYSAATLSGTTNQVNVANASHSITLSLPQSIATSSSPQFTGLNLSGLTASQAVVTNVSNNLVSLAYTSSNTASTLVERDSSGNFSAGTITANLTGNASTATTATTATNANNVATTQVSSNSSYYPLMVASSTNSNQAADLGTGLTFNPSTNTLTTTTFSGALNGNATSATTATNANNIATLAAGTNANFPLIFVASSTNSNQAPELNANLNYNPATATLNLNGGGGISSSLNIGSSAASLLGTTKSLTFSNSLSAGNYINLGTGGRNIGVFQGGNAFYTMGLDYNVTGTNYLYVNSGSATGVALELTTAGGFNFNTAPSGSNGAAATVTTRFSISNTGVVNVPNITASSLVVTDPSSNLSATNTLSSTVLSNIPKVTTTSLTSGSGTYTPPANCTSIRVRCWGGGGGGGGAAGTTANAAGAGGGGGGGYCEGIITSPSGGGYSYSVGAFGGGGAAGNNPGSNGSASTFGTFSAGGGGSGAGSAAGLGPTIGLGSNGGTSSGGLINATGGTGGNGVILSGTISVGGFGGAASCGGGMIRGRSGTNTGLSGNFPGGGGAGATSTSSSNFAGGDGAIGLIIVQEYYNG